MRRSLVRRSTKSCFDHHCLLCSQCLHPPSPRRSTRQMTAGGVCSPRAVRAVWLWVHTHTNTRGRTCQDQDARKQNTKRDVVARVSGLLFGEQLTADRDCIGFASSARVPGLALPTPAPEAPRPSLQNGANGPIYAKQCSKKRISSVYTPRISG